MIQLRQLRHFLLITLNVAKHMVALNSMYCCVLSSIKYNMGSTLPVFKAINRFHCHAIQKKLIENHPVDKAKFKVCAFSQTLDIRRNVSQKLKMTK